MTTKRSLTAGRRTNLALLVALGAALGSGLLAFALGHPGGGWAALLHGVAGISILVLSPWKSIIVRRGLARRRRYRSASLALTILIVVALASGLSHSTGLLVGFDGLSAMQVHVGAALLALPFALWHLRTRPWRAHRTDLSRRHALRSAAWMGISALGYSGLEAVLGLLAASGSARRFTGSLRKRLTRHRQHAGDAVAGRHRPLAAGQGVHAEDRGSRRLL